MILVTGGAGFIGSNLVAALECRGCNRLVVVDRLGHDDKWRNIAGRSLYDLVAPEQLHEFLGRYGSEIELIFHLGAISATTETNVDLIVQNNFRFSLDLWEWCIRAGTRLIYASSAATYGDGGQGFDDDSARIATLRPLNAYGWSKHLLDRRVLAAASAGMPTPPQWVGLKFFNVYGPNEYHKGDMRSLVAKLYADAVAGRPARLFASDRPDYIDGGQLRDFIWVADCIDVMLWLYDRPQVSGLFNLGTGKARSWNDLAAALYRACGRAPLVEYIQMPERLAGKYQYFTEAPMQRLRSAGYTAPFTTLEEGVGRYVRDFLSAPCPYA